MKRRNFINLFCGAAALALADVLVPKKGKEEIVEADEYETVRIMTVGTVGFGAICPSSKLNIQTGHPAPQWDGQTFEEYTELREDM